MKTYRNTTLPWRSWLGTEPRAQANGSCALTYRLWGRAMGNIARPPCDEAAILAPESVPCSADCGPWILAVTILGSSMAFIDGTVVNVALPALQSALGATVSDVQWIVESYALLL